MRSKVTGGPLGWYTINGLEIAVVIKDRRENYGRVDVLIEPVSGRGQKWVRAESITEGDDDDPKP